MKKKARVYKNIYTLTHTPDMVLMGVVLDKTMHKIQSLDTV
jgi:hypothetical protein